MSFRAGYSYDPQGSYHSKEGNRRDATMVNDLAKQRRKEKRRSKRNSKLAETMLDDARNEVLDAHSNPFLSDQEQKLQQQMEQASVVSSVDSDNYEFQGKSTGESVSGLLSANSKVDEAYMQHLEKGGSE